MTDQDEIAILGRLTALEFLLRFEVAERLRAQAMPASAVDALRDVAVAAIKLEALTTPGADAETYRGAAAATGSFYSEVKKLLVGVKPT